MKIIRKGHFSPRRIAAIMPSHTNRTVVVTWADEGMTAIDLMPWLKSGALTKLLDQAYFASAAIGENGWTITWGGQDIEIDSIHLQMLEAEQHGVVYSPDALKRWRERHGLTLVDAAHALGLSRRMVAYYESGGKVIPKNVALACKGFDALKAELQVRSVA